MNRFIREPSSYQRTPVRAEQPAVKAEPGVATLRLYDPVDSWGGEWGVSAKEFTAALDALPQDTTQIRLLVNSPGGEVWDALAILNALRAHPARVTAVVEGIAASAASFIAAGADELHVMQNAELMVHKAMGIGIGNADDLTKLSTDLTHEDRNIASVYAGKAGGSVEDWLDVMSAETWFSAQEAVAAGLADRVVEPPQQDAEKAATARARFDMRVFNFAGRAAAPAPRFPAATAGPKPLPAGQGQPEKEGAMADVAKLREGLGLGPDASDDEVKAAFAAAYPVDTPPADIAPSEAAPEGAKTPDTKATIIVATSVWEEQQRTIKDLSDFVAKTKRDERDSVLDQAVRDGKFRPTQLGEFRDLWDKDPEGIRNLVGRMTPNSALAVAALGYANDVEGDLDDEFAGLFPPSGKGR